MRMKSLGWKSLVFVALMATIACQAPTPQKNAKAADTSTQVLHAHFYDSGFSLADDNYNACFRASKGKIYYVLCSGSVDTGAQMYALDAATGKIEHVADLTEAAGEDRKSTRLNS